MVGHKPLRFTTQIIGTDGDNMKKCGRCKELKPLSDFWKNKSKSDGLQNGCKTCHYSSVMGMLEGQDRDKYLKMRRNRHLQVKYGITVDEYDTMLKAQDGMCAICGVDRIGRNMPVDHDHQTGEIRGILCENCNRGLGLFMDNPHNLRLAADYIDKFK